MAGKENLKPIKSTEEARERGRKGGIASGKARREKRLLKETLEALLSMPIKDGQNIDIEKIKSFASIKGQNISVQEALTIAMIQKAMKGDVKAAEFCRDTIGENPTNKIEMDADMTLDIKVDYGDEEE